ncbi:MAG: hypothetical protein LQ338_004530 [Usnochroma carphineum]|nr:MAG: hypothetical protein LQ338_004530 [Usnochroma carphineum]
MPSRTHPSDVINTVSSAIGSLENAAFQDHDEDSTYSQSKRSRRSNAKTKKHLDSSNETRTSQISIDVNDLSKSFRHFVPPPPPVPLADAPSSKPTSSSKRRSNASTPIKERTYSTTLTITEHTLPSGLKTYQASISPVVRTSSPSARPAKPRRAQFSQPLTPNEVTLIDMSPPPSSPSPSFFPSSPRQPFLTRMRKRQQAWEAGLDGKNKREIWRLISVKRQRKLKMKKHKYKKLMRKTRNLRRRLDRN